MHIRVEAVPLSQLLNTVLAAVDLCNLWTVWRLAVLLLVILGWIATCVTLLIRHGVCQINGNCDVVLRERLAIEAQVFFIVVGDRTWRREEREDRSGNGVTTRRFPKAHVQFG